MREPHHPSRGELELPFVLHALSDPALPVELRGLREMMPEMDARLERTLREAYRRESVQDRDGTSIELFPHSVGLRQGEALRDLAIAEEAERTIEIGLALGISALFL